MIYRAIVKSVFVLHPGYSLRALRNKLRLTLLIIRNWPGLKGSEREDFFSIPAVVPRPPLEQIAAKKRAMYRRRYELLDGIFAQLDSAVRHQLATRGEEGRER
ncbi:MULTISPECIES: DUF535 family protein [Pseudomonas]|uniref:DUF535 family protein n=1 Tax=Pseudomonas TaxID=286 RepID=UPI002DBF9EB6|nr:DUF535 family protein [Pseudomonas asiatica]MEB6592137.1 VirK/YbjX family protein [Pseudomonas asiatica]